ncbi:type IV pilus biogenesis protein PilP [Acidithiobacillus caldus]|uniref:type IV pilus biogenesis protein PilP n=1 Tax=Acidithiobacillus caldus TaxID=33059 RepID=UPI000B04EF70|nr:type IV pilus biogenesis protein PilP [Acidithiobacillus caldus]
MSQRVFTHSEVAVMRIVKGVPRVLAVSAAIWCGLAGIEAWAGPMPSSAPASATSSSSETASVPDGGDSTSVTLAALARAQNEAALLRVQLDIAKLKEEIRKAKEGKSTGENASAPKPYLSSGFPAGQATLDGAMDKARKTGMPKVLSIYGKGDGQDVAELALPNGGTVLVHSGMNLAPYGRVERVSGNGVYFSAHGKRRVLPIAVSGGAIANVSDLSNTFATPGAIPTLNPPAPITSAPRNFGPPPSNVLSVPPMLPGKGD